MIFITKEWKDRLVEFAGRRKLTNVSSGEEMLVDVSRSEGQVSQAGDAFSAASMNDLEQRIADGFGQVNSNMQSLGESVADGKSAIASAITSKGVNTATDAEFAVMAANIGKIETAHKTLVSYSAETSTSETDKVYYINIPASYKAKGVYVLIQDDRLRSGYDYGITINTGGYNQIFSNKNTGVHTILLYYPNITGGQSISFTKKSLGDYKHKVSYYAFV